MATIKERLLSKISSYINQQVKKAVEQISINSELRRKEFSLDQPTCDQYLICPSCCVDQSLQHNSQNLSCSNCGFIAEINFGIPCLIKNEERGVYCDKFLGNSSEFKEIKSPHQKWKLNWCRRIFGQELIHFLNAAYFFAKLGPKKMLTQKYCDEVERTCSVWPGYHNLILKAGETAQFEKMKKYIINDSLEIGCGDSRTTNLIFQDIVPSITFGCEYFMDGFIDELDGLGDGMCKVIKNYVGGSISSLPFRSGVFNSVVTVHIIDHIVHFENWFKEINRILKPGGHLLMTATSKYVFENLPGVKIRKIFSSNWAERYKDWRIVKENPRGNPMKSDFEFDATGQNIFSEREWKEIASKFGFELVDCSFFGKYFSYFKEIESRGYYNSLIFNKYILAAISEMIEREKVRPLSEAESTNIMLVFRKV